LTKIAILQSSYIPWKGVFDLINQVDKFVFLEDVQFTKRDWRSRNKIKNANGEMWLSVPVKKAQRDLTLHEIQISQDIDWQRKHYESILHSYAKAPFFYNYKWVLEKIYMEKKWSNLSEFNIFTTKLISELLSIKTEFFNSNDLSVAGSKDDKLINICKKLKGEFYLSGPAAKDYISNEKFYSQNIKLAYIIYEYPEYKQVYEGFNHYFSILDVIFNCGDDMGKYIFSNKYEEVSE
jgi:hypothetical protein